MGCPLFVDYSRECIVKIEIYPSQITHKILNLCTTGDYKECPFYRILYRKESVCKNIMNCPVFSKFQIDDFDKFMELSREYCVSKNHKKCKRYIISKKGKGVPPHLHPDGRYIKEWKNQRKQSI